MKAWIKKFGTSPVLQATTLTLMLGLGATMIGVGIGTGVKSLSADAGICGPEGRGKGRCGGHFDCEAYARTKGGESCNWVPYYYIIPPPIPVPELPDAGPTH